MSANAEHGLNALRAKRDKAQTLEALAPLLLAALSELVAADMRDREDGSVARSYGPGSLRDRMWLRAQAVLRKAAGEAA